MLLLGRLFRYNSRTILNIRLNIMWSDHTPRVIPHNGVYWLSYEHFILFDTAVYGAFSKLILLKHWERTIFIFSSLRLWVTLLECSSSTHIVVLILMYGWLICSYFQHLVFVLDLLDFIYHELVFDYSLVQIAHDLLQFCWWNWWNGRQGLLNLLICQLLYAT